LRKQLSAGIGPPGAIALENSQVPESQPALRDGFVALSGLPKPGLGQGEDLCPD